MIHKLSTFVECSRNVIMQNSNAITTGESTCFVTFNRISLTSTCGRQKNEVWNLT
ncbi:hypothetical protein GHT06_017800 [Daphnia sinensis]|uniref:Uncharacterized protein n=1 Tax=Daphnia sinensis TaxID=1820382 RepID=A0AAD5PU40_9CRUS|nr:hypothetical protein GHT06_017800 [Daphnia sinensis]